MSTTTTEGRVIHWARLYDLSTSFFDRRQRANHERILERASIRPGDRVLDIGCGPGWLTLAAAHAAGATGEAIGIDPSPEMVALAKQNAARQGSMATFQLAPIQAIPSPANHFDVVLTSLALHHVPPELQGRGFSEVLRVLKPAGRFVALDIGGTPGHGIGHLLCVLGLRRGFEHVEHLRSLAATAGLEAIEVEPVSRALCLLHAQKPRSSAQ